MRLRIKLSYRVAVLAVCGLHTTLRDSMVLDGLPVIPGLEGNPYFSAGFGLGILGTGLAALRGGARTAVALAQRHLLVTLEVTSKDKAYPWVLHWMTRQARGGALGQHITVDTVSRRLANGTTTTNFEFTPCPGRHVLTYQGHLMMVDRTREQVTLAQMTFPDWYAKVRSRCKTSVTAHFHFCCTLPSTQPHVYRASRQPLICTPVSHGKQSN